MYSNQLVSADFRTWPIAADWQPLIAAFFATEAGIKLQEFLVAELAAGKMIFPNQPLRALQLTAVNQVRAVILGQDPYHGVGQAEGLAFSVASGVKPPPSLRNIFKELQRDLGCPPPVSGSLQPWARAGVLLLNSCLTVQQAQPNSHANNGWEQLTDSIIQYLDQQPQPILFLLWGKPAQAKASLLKRPQHRILTANHPSPFSANRAPQPFIGCGHFSELQQHLLPQIDFKLALEAAAPQPQAMQLPLFAD